MLFLVFGFLLVAMVILLVWNEKRKGGSDGIWALSLFGIIVPGGVFIGLMVWLAGNHMDLKYNMPPERESIIEARNGYSDIERAAMFEQVAKFNRSVKRMKAQNESMWLDCLYFDDELDAIKEIKSSDIKDK